MIGLLPFAILILSAAAALLAWSGFKTITAFQRKKPIPKGVLLSFLSALALTAVILRVALALTIGLAHSRAPFEYTRWHGLACLVLIFILPGLTVLAYQIKTKNRAE